MSGPLSGLKVLELTSVVLGPWAAQIIADMGADVIKIEAPFGDSNRQLGASKNPGMAALYLSNNRNKRSLVLDLKQESARDALLAIVKDCDVFLHNNRPQVMTKLRLEYEDIKSVNENIIYCGTYGYSKDGPYGEKGALDDSIQAVSGVAALNELVLGEPRYLPTVVADKTTAITVVYSILAALFHRERSGVGQEIEVPMFETMVSFVMAEHIWGEVFEPKLGEAGYTRLMSHHRKPYKTKDGYIAVLPYMNNHWKTFCEKAEREDLIEDERFKDLSSRVKNIDDTYSETGKILATKTTQEWLDIFAGTKVPVIVVNSLEDLFHDPHLEAVDFWKSFDHPTEGQLKMPGFPSKFSKTPASIRKHAPKLGEHSKEILAEAGIDEETINKMLDSKATLISD
ncbi:MAG: CoA transferase [Gammaproteobacteria bacterium]|jgi:crotonobetainyl-CoA:carnitine CoA-transferase CaiB-like acyl-CoA transferase|nr:CoA transferase [Gammaproteobacteria bacterium]|tara:strand:- start:2839 stop:4035 length:1197 start_codon:yes stop_codon:yes gene_type:complete